MKYFLIIVILLFAATAQADWGACAGACSSEQGICIAGCNGNGDCIARCNSAHGRCISRCYQHNNQGQQGNDQGQTQNQSQKTFDYTPQNNFKSNLDRFGKVD